MSPLRSQVGIKLHDWVVCVGLPVCWPLAHPCDQMLDLETVILEFHGPLSQIRTACLGAVS